LKVLQEMFTGMAFMGAEKATAQEKDENLGDIKFQEWAAEPNGIFRPTCTAVSKLPSAVYKVGIDDRGAYFDKMKIETDDLIILDDTASQQVVEGIRTFWKKKDQYAKYGIVYKRGVLLKGPQGTGKTASLMLLTKELLHLGGIVVFISNPNAAAVCLHFLRMIEPERPLIAIYEDLDEMIREYGEHQILSLLDGENQVSNITNLATTNFPEKLGGRIINRPSRFDEVVEIGYPNEKARRRFLKHITKVEPLTDEELKQWVKDTDKLSISHIRELVVAIRCLGQDYAAVLNRLKEMTKAPEPFEEFTPKNKQGFGR
jgi:AAA+ superfamily predicted ATPase